MQLLMPQAVYTCRWHCCSTLVHGAHFDLRPLQRAKTSFYNHQSFVTTGSVLKADGIIVGFQHPFAVVFLSLADLDIINANLVVIGYR
jgi:hypothetical protein